MNCRKKQDLLLSFLKQELLAAYALIWVTALALLKSATN
jgi:hypothetical protein